MKKQDKDFLHQNMSIDTDWLEREISSFNQKTDIEIFISNLIRATRSDDAKKQITEHFDSATLSNVETKTYEILDSLRHAFTLYLSGGLYDLYIYQSNESWYPKIKLRHELKPNDILDLPNSIEIYRGCDISEHNRNKYGQSWSTSIQVATKFAYQHYASQPWYDKEKRCILKAIIKKENVLFSRQHHYEKEIAVSIEKLVNVQKT